MDRSKAAAKQSEKEEDRKSLASEADEENLEGFIEMLYAHQLKCEEECKYVEAEMAKNRVDELKKELKRRQEAESQMKFQADLEELEQAHIQEFNTFNEEWDVKMNEFHVHSAGLLRSLEEKHEQELLENREELEKKLGDNYKQSPMLISLISTQKNLAKQKEYQQAHQIQIKAQELELQEREKYLQEREKKLVALENKLIKKQETEMESLRKRIVAGENEQK